MKNNSLDNTISINDLSRVTGGFFGSSDAPPSDTQCDGFANAIAANQLKASSQFKVAKGAKDAPSMLAAVSSSVVGTNDRNAAMKNLGACGFAHE